MKCVRSVDGLQKTEKYEKKAICGIHVPSRSISICMYHVYMSTTRVLIYSYRYISGTGHHRIIHTFSPYIYYGLSTVIGKGGSVGSGMDSLSEFQAGKTACQVIYCCIILRPSVDSAAQKLNEEQQLRSDNCSS